jgi:hypothetical protein
VFVNDRGEPLTRWGFAYLLKQYVATAARQRPGLKKKRVSPHVLRHYLPRPTMSGSFDRNDKYLRNKGISCRDARATRHGRLDLQAVQELQQMVAGPEAG